MHKVIGVPLVFILTLHSSVYMLVVYNCVIYCVIQTHNNVEGWARLLAAVMEALCHPLVKLTSLFPVGSEHGYTPVAIPGSSTDDNTPTSTTPTLQNPYDTTQYPLLVGHMLHMTEMEGARIGAGGQWSFREVLDRMLTIAVLPVRQALSKVRLYGNAVEVHRLAFTHNMQHGT